MDSINDPRLRTSTYINFDYSNSDGKINELELSIQEKIFFIIKKKKEEDSF